MELIQQKLRELEMLAHQSKVPMNEVVNGIRRQFYYAALERRNGNRCAAARDMGKHRNTFDRAEKELGIHAEKHGKRAAICQTCERYFRTSTRTGTRRSYVNKRRC